MISNIRAIDDRPLQYCQETFIMLLDTLVHLLHLSLSDAAHFRQEQADASLQPLTMETGSLAVRQSGLQDCATSLQTLT